MPESCHARRTNTGPQFFSLRMESIIDSAPDSSAFVTEREEEAVDDRPRGDGANAWAPEMAARRMEAQAIFMVSVGMICT